jgi:hypothetical protein
MQNDKQDNGLQMQTNPDFISLRRYNNSLKRLMERYPDGCPTHIVASALEITEDELETRYQKIVTTLKTRMGV